ncbi:thiamine phosphate synthase [Paenibacillus glycinis]|uniref:Thiamine-phosphate synthase n=1 Tax=Paenibacillus glycinis TaxID=2697035 RepID=A0ABW9XW36_9BACL|nr:thiamine phosphate synthase [Paenibacillus glycinis]NBD26839.1 thiamine phosphate synthase [Paenibacillus glycinis]
MEKRNWRDFKLYAITAANYHPGRDLLEVMEQAILGGADIVQLRAKDAPKEALLRDARALRELTARYGVPLIVNDHIDVALAAGADGAHIGQDDLPLAEARRILGPDAIIGISTHNLAQALAAERGGADYIGVGPVYPTGTKPGRAAVTTAYVREAAANVSIPWVAIGGITLANAGEVLAAGATRICAVSAIVGSERPAEVCRAFRAKLDAARAGGEPGSIAITVNGRRERTSARTVGALVESLGLAGKSLVVELNGEIVAREAWATAAIADGASLELVHFVGGG